MTVELVRELRRKWYPPDGGPFEAALYQAFDQVGFSEGAGAGSDRGYIDSAIDGGKRSLASVKSKVVKDSVWGMVDGVAPIKPDTWRWVSELE
jgi:hypothetical protein